MYSVFKTCTPPFSDRLDGLFRDVAACACLGAADLQDRRALLVQAWCVPAVVVAGTLCYASWLL